MYLMRFAPAFIGAVLLSTAPAHAQAATAAKSTRTYDCTKAGNANKAACKNAVTTKPAPAAKAPPAAVTATKTTTAHNYDCSKPGNANKAVCKSAVAKPPVAAATAPAPASVAATAARPTAARTTTTAKVTTTNAAGPNGATAQCKDGTYSKSKHRSGTCAGHKGVATWY